ncbi:MAG TPA: hypothetical protein VKE40_06915 [Gemmataceae bacterium]|nr:hypothetical protein [Gemmataceae bacterium]
MSGYYDVYALAPARTAEAVERFLARFAPAREPAADEYEVPRYADTPAVVFHTPAELVAHCVAHPAEPHGLYWRCLGSGDPAHVMVFFTPDGGLILGVSVTADPERWLAELLASTGSKVGGVGFEEPPPDTASEFAGWTMRAAEPLGAPDRGGGE